MTEWLPRQRHCLSPLLPANFLASAEELYKKDIHNQDNHDGVITHLEPDILECEVKWALENITTNKASGGGGIPVELFQILKDDAVTQKKIYFCFIDYAKFFDCEDHNILWKIPK